MTERKSNPGAFVKGDPRCWRKGRPKGFDALREMTQAVLAEEAVSGGQPIIINGHKATGAEVIIRQWMQSKEFKKQQAVLEIAYGKVPDELKVQGDAVMRVVIDLGDRGDDPGLPSRAEGDTRE